MSQSLWFNVVAEVRAAPHMDNLVSIFKSMEVATGTSILSTQLAPAAKNTGKYEAISSPFGPLSDTDTVYLKAQEMPSDEARIK